MKATFTVKRKLHFATGDRGRRHVRQGKKPVKSALDSAPRIARLMALAIHFDELIRQGKVKDYAELARLGQVSRARITQIMGLLNLAPGIQESLLTVTRTNSDLCLRSVGQLLRFADWNTQRRVSSHGGQVN